MKEGAKLCRVVGADAILTHVSVVRRLYVTVIAMLGSNPVKPGKIQLLTWSVTMGV